MKCHNCNKELDRRNSKYCNIQCQKNREFQLRLQASLTSGKFGGSVRSIKRMVTHIHGHKCSRCGIEEWQGQKAPLVMDHIDGNSDNWSVDNLRLVCGNCDMQLPTYKNRNKGNGRHTRKQRYAAGKSY